MKVHLTAIGGTGMGALAGLLVEAGEEVRGSDGPLYPPMSTLLEELEIPVYGGYAATHLDWGPDLVVLGNSCRKDHPEYVAAQERGLKVVSFPELLSERFLHDRHSIVVAGTHGKTTTTAMISHLLRTAGLDPGFLIGGVPIDTQKSFALGKPPYFVLEGDEYDCACFDKRPKFVHYRPRTVVLTGVEFDHADIYANMSEVRRAFEMLIELIPKDGRLLVAADSQVALEVASKARCPVLRYGVTQTESEATSTRKLAIPLNWNAFYESVGGGRTEMVIFSEGDEIGSFEIGLYGAHNMANALAAVAVAHSLKVGPSTIAAGLASFKGVARRQQILGIERGITVIDDFAHHPTAVRETLRGLRNRKGRLIVAFEPRSATSRRRVFQAQYAESLGEADHVVIGPLFLPERIPEADRLDIDALARTLSSGGTPAHALDIPEITAHLMDHCQPGDTVVFMSSGSFGGLQRDLLAALRAQ
jgi:UDP-N-acetylmuramate: L-alanyl-gamma-D-glutamyl-meso-diaminopimelate ligase